MKKENLKNLLMRQINHLVLKIKLIQKEPYKNLFIVILTIKENFRQLVLMKILSKKQMK